MTAGVTLSAADMVGYALKAMLRNAGALVGLCSPSLLIIVGAAVAGRMLYPPEAEGEMPGGLPLLMFASLAANVALVPAFTGWHRLLILGDVSRGAAGGAYGWDRREWRYFAALIGIWCLMFAINIAANIVVSLAPSGLTFAFAIVATVAGYLAVWANLGLGLPAAALGDGRKFSELNKLAGGNLRRIAFAIGAVWLTLLVGGGLIAAAVGAALMTFGSIYLVFVLGMLFYYVGLVGSVGVLSRAYDLLNRPD